MVKYACIGYDSVTLLDHITDGGIENWVILPKTTIHTIRDNLDIQTYIISPYRHEPYIKISIYTDNISIDYSWGKEKTRKFVISKEGLLKILQKIDNNGELVNIE